MRRSIMVQTYLRLVLLMSLVALLGCTKQEEAFNSMDKNGITVSIDVPLHGTLSVTTAVVSGQKVKPGTVITLQAKPDEGYVLDSLYYAVDGQWGTQYIESMTEQLKVKITQPLRIGVAFLPEESLSGIETIQDVMYAKPGVKPLKYDIFRPVNTQNLPLIVIIHGGGWRTNDENIMRGMAREIAKTGRYVVASIDYRWLGTLDGETKPVQVWQLIEDVYGAILHIQEHAKQYGADPDRIALTGDSAGGHLCASAAVMIERIGSSGFIDPYFQFNPSYIPQGKTVKEVQAQLLRSIKVAAPSYGVFGGTQLAQAVGVGEDMLKYIAPIHAIPTIAQRSIPHYLIRGSDDPLISLEMVSSYAEALVKAGQPVRQVEVDGAGHAFFDWKPDAVTRKTFERFGVPYIRDMLSFIDSYL